jgi:hypothetical protein
MEDLQGISVYFCDFQSLLEQFGLFPPNTQEGPTPIMQVSSKVPDFS